MKTNIAAIRLQQHNYFLQGHTKSLSNRSGLLRKLALEIRQQTPNIHQALQSDLRKPEVEALASETMVVLNDIQFTLKHLKSWAKPRRVSAAYLNFPSKDWILAEPYGQTLHISPWNYPFQLAMAPVIGAVAAGNTVVLKPSELSPATSAIVESIISKVFDPGFVAVIQGGPEVASVLLKERWDYIFFTGGVQVGKIVAKAAAEQLTPTTLELGGKNPCLIEKTANLKVAARRIVWGKFFNCGQTCIAPDYMLVDKKVKNAFVEHLVREIQNAYTENPQNSLDYGRIINAKHFDRLMGYIENQRLLWGGVSNKEDLYIAPTLVEVEQFDTALMQEEIFGPILPIVEFDRIETAQNIIRSYEKPLSFYVFSENKKLAQKLMNGFSFGGGAINDTIVQFANPKLPFGGVGHSGMGHYHGKASFDTFTHYKPFIYRPTWIDIPFRYAPYKNKHKFIKFFLSLFQ